MTLDTLSLPMFQAAGFVLWDRIIWNYFGSRAFKSKFTNRHETILWLVKPATKGATKPVFNLDEVRERSVSYDARNHLLGRNPGNVWQADRVAFGSIGQTSHLAVFPEEVSEKLVRSVSNLDDLLLDPFSGSGTLPKVALTLGRQFIGCEISPAYVRDSDRRLRMWGWSESENLLLGLLVKFGFGGKPGSKEVSHLAAVVERFLSGRRNPQLEDLQESVGAIIGAERLTKALKQRKESLWRSYDGLIGRVNESDPVVAADLALAFCFAHRKRWNGVRRYLSAGQCLAKLRSSIQKGSDLSDRIKDLAERANTRFSISRHRITCESVDPGLGCSVQPAIPLSEEFPQQELVLR